MPTPNFWVMHIEAASVSPEDHGGAGVWSPEKLIRLEGENVNEAAALAGIQIQPPRFRVDKKFVMPDEIDGTMYKGLPVHIMAATEKDGESLQSNMGTYATEDVVITIRGWGQFRNKTRNLVLVVLWAKGNPATNGQFLSFTMGEVSLADDGGMAAPQYFDFGKGNKPSQDKAGRLASMKGADVPGLASAPGDTWFPEPLSL